MKKFSITLVLALLAMVCVSGCSTTTAETYSQRNFRLARSWEMDLKSAGDDLDYILLIDRSSSLTRWHKRVGF